MMKICFKVSLVWLLSHVQCWQPISQPHPAAFSVYQTFPDLASETSLRNSKSNGIQSDVDDLFLDSISSKNEFSDDGSCAVEKFAIDHEAIVKYNTGFAKLDQLTLCMWARFTKHDGDHVLFTYSVHDEPREIQFWIANVNSSSFISMAVRGHSLYRLNYPLAMKKWYHTCTSWNGKTGEWQLWVQSERVGRGFYNRLVSHEIEAGGNAFTGGKSPNGPTAEGLHYEVTLAQVYSVALSAGKAHRNHKHHHVHKFDHNGEVETTTAVPTVAPVNQPINPLLANGQFPSRVRINLAGAQQPEGAPQPAPPQQQQQQVINTNFVRGQFHTGTRNLQQQLLNGNFAQQVQRQPTFGAPPPSSSVSRFPSPSGGQQSFTSSYTGFGSNPANVQIIDEANLPNLRFKRQPSKTVDKRELVTLTDGSVVDDKFFDTDWFDGLAQFGDSGLKQSLTKRANLEDEIKEHDREPAEGEVEAVKAYCNHCLVEPFQSALVMSWKEAVAGKNVLKAKASTVCGHF